MIDLNAVANGPNEAACALCNGRGFYGSPGRRCDFCDGTGRVKWRSRPVADQPLNTTPAVDQKTAEMIRNVMGMADKYWEASTAARYRVRAELEQVVRAALCVTPCDGGKNG